MCKTAVTNTPKTLHPYLIDHSPLPPFAAALHVWKTVVTNTPKTLGELLPALMAIIIESLADPGAPR